MFTPRYGTIFGFIKYAEIYVSDSWLDTSVHQTFYDISWSRLSRRVNAWIYEHEHDILI